MFLGKVNGCSLIIGLRSIFRKFCWKKKKLFYSFFFFFLMFDIKMVLKLFKNGSLKNVLNEPNNKTLCFYVKITNMEIAILNKGQ